MKRKMVPEDLYKLKLVSDVQMSPCGSWVVYVKTVFAGEENEEQSHIWILDVESGEEKQYTYGPKSDSQPRFSPDGRYLAFVRQVSLGNGQGEDRQIWLISLAGGEAYQLTSMRYGASMPVWAPDSQSLAFLSQVGLDDEYEKLIKPMSEQDRKEEKKKKQNEAFVTRDLRYKFDTSGLFSEKRMQIWVVEIKEKDKPKQVTNGQWNKGVPSWSPDGKRLAFAGNDSTQADYERISDIYVVDVDTTEYFSVTGRSGAFYHASWSPDGKTLGVIGHTNEYYGATLLKLWLFPVLLNSEGRLLTADFDRGIGNVVGSDTRPGGFGSFDIFWSPQGDTIYFTASDQGANHLFRVNISTGEVNRLIDGKRELYSVSMDAKREKIVAAVSSITLPGDIFLFAGSERRLTEVNQEILDELELADAEEITFKGADGWDIQGWLLKPIGFEGGKKYPLVLEIHGGPHTAYGYSFYQEMQLLAAEGYVVLFTNPRGSDSYGQLFNQACQKDYGGKDYEDLMKAVDYTISLGYVDETKLGVTGGSYGGFMTNWIVSQTDRFAVAVTHRSISNWVTFYGVSDIGPWFTDSEHGELTPWENLDELWNISPMKYVDKVTTPIQICHSENDLRCPMEQAEQFYTALKILKRETEFVRHPRSNHELTRSGPAILRVDRFHKNLEWYRRYLG